MDAQLERFILRELARHHVMSIATVRQDGFPQVTSVTYASDAFDLYFACDRGAQKVRNLRRNSKVSLAIDRDMKDWSRLRGLSMGGHAHVLRGAPQKQHAFGLLQRKFPQWSEIDLAELATLSFVKVVPTVISALDYSKGFGHTDLVTLRAS